MSTLAELCATPPSPTAGIPIGVGDWRFGVEILLPRAQGFVVFDGTEGNYLQVPDDPVFDLPDAGVVPQAMYATARVKVDDLPGDLHTVMAKWGDAGARSWWFGVDGDAKPVVRWSPNGTDVESATCPNALPAGFIGSIIWSFSVSFPAQLIVSISTDGVTWSVLGTASFGVSQVFKGSAPLTIGADATGADPWEGRIYRAALTGMRRGTVFELGELDAALEPDAATVTALTGQTVTAVRTDPAHLEFGAAHSRWQGPHSNGDTKWGSATWTGKAWRDITHYVRGVDWSRGNDDRYGRAEAGEIHVTLDARTEFDLFDRRGTFGTHVLGAGLLIRAWLRSPTSELVDVLLDEDGDPILDEDEDAILDEGQSIRAWLPQFTALTELWRPTYNALMNERQIEITAVETISELAGVDDNALLRPIRPENGVDRIRRLIAAAGWRYGFLNASYYHAGGAPPDNYRVIGTDMAENRLTELYLTADSISAQVWTDRTGALRLADRSQNGSPLVPPGVDQEAWWAMFPLRDYSCSSAGVWTIGVSAYSGMVDGVVYAAYDPDTFRAVEDRLAVVNEAEFGQRGADANDPNAVPGATGLRAYARHRESIGRWKRRRLARYDLLSGSQNLLEEVTWRYVAEHGSNAIVLDDVTVWLSRDRPTEWLAFCAMDLGDLVRVLPPDTPLEAFPDEPFMVGYLARLRHTVTPLRPGRVLWTVDVGVDVRTVFNLPGGQMSIA